MPVPRFLPAFALIALLTACTGFQRSDIATAAQKRMPGMSREEVLACMGPARKKASEGATEVWSYLSTNGSSSYNSGSSKISGGYGATIYNGGGSHSRSFCTVNIVMKNAVVTAVHYNGPSGDIFAPNEQCGYAVANCVGPGLE